MTTMEPTGAFGEGRLLPRMECTWCDSTERVEPQCDPWGCFDGRYLCERCIDSYHDGGGSWHDAMEAKYPVEKLREVME